MIKYYVIGFLSFLLLASGFWAQHQSLKTLRNELTKANAQIELQNAAWVALSARTDAIQILTEQASKEAQENRNALQKAIRTLPDGGSRRTPSAIVDSLCKSLNCRTGDVQVQPVPTPRR